MAEARTGVIVAAVAGLALLVLGGVALLGAGGAAFWMWSAERAGPAGSAPVELPTAQAGTAAPSPAATPADAPSPAVNANPAGPAETALPDLSKDLAKGLCENGPGKEGADNYFVGELRLDGTAVSGTETWVLFANEHWKKRGGKDCTITWKVTGAKTRQGACADCDLSIKVEGSPNVAGSDCPEGLVKMEAKPMTEVYEVQRLTNGEAHFYFGRSGKRFAQGYHNGDRMVYVTNHRCSWF